MQREAQITKDRAVLLILTPLEDPSVVEDVCAHRCHLYEDAALPELENRVVYLCGDLEKASAIDFSGSQRVLVIRELAENIESRDAEWEVVTRGQVPVLVHGLSVYFRRLFEGEDLFKEISKAHRFQSLTEFKKPSSAHRRGLYLTPVTRRGSDLHFRLLRCSTNLSGPTENFSGIDHSVVDALNGAAGQVFDDVAVLNHVLAQIYFNRAASPTQKQSKAKISTHADKTKDMDSAGLLAFCTFYDGLEKLSPLSGDPFGLGYKERSGLNQLLFKRKKTVPASGSLEALPESFSVTLYPNSAFLVPLSTNRLYTHEIRSSILDAEMLPTRMGYVVRSSKTEARHSAGQTFCKELGAKSRWWASRNALSEAPRTPVP